MSFAGVGRWLGSGLFGGLGPKFQKFMRDAIGRTGLFRLFSWKYFSFLFSFYLGRSSQHYCFNFIVIKLHYNYLRPQIFQDACKRNATAAITNFTAIFAARFKTS